MTGDVPTARSQIGTHFHGNLCVAVATRSAAQVEAQMRQLQELLLPSGGPSVGVYPFGPTQRPLGDPILSIDMVVAHPGIAAILRQLGGPPVVVTPWIQPVG